MEKRYYAGVLAVATSLVLGGCGVSQSPVTVIAPEGEKVEWAIYSEGIYCYSDGSLYGYVAEDGREISPCIYSEASPFSQGLACVCLNGKYGYIGQDGETVLEFVYDQASPFWEGTAYFSRDGEYGLIDRESYGELRLEGCESISAFREGLAYFCRDGLYGYMDQDGQVAIEPAYDDAGYFYEGLARVGKGGYCGVIARDGREVLSPRYSDVVLDGNYTYARREDRTYCFDREGRELFSGLWDGMKEEEGMFLLRRYEDGYKYGLADGSGKVVLEPKYDSVELIPKWRLVIARDGGGTGVLDYEGQVRVPLIHHSIAADEEGLRIIDADPSWKVGYLSGEDLSVKIPMIYDDMSAFASGRAAVELGGKWGVIRSDGAWELPAVYDKISLFSDGSMAVWTGEEVRLTDRKDKLLLTGPYDHVRELGQGYETKLDGKNSYWDRQGNLIAQDYSVSSAVSLHGTANTYFLGNDMLLKTGEEDGKAQERFFLNNWITPEAGSFYTFFRQGSVWLGDGGDHGHAAGIEELRQRGRIFCKLYRIGDEKILYFDTGTWESLGEDYSGVFSVRDGEIEPLVSGERFGGSHREARVYFRFDNAEDVWKMSVSGTFGGFGGYADHCEIYRLENGQAVREISLKYFFQVAGNYGREDRLENAGLFYDEEDRPYTEETILQAEYLTEYLLDGRRVSAEEYYEAKERYEHRYYPTPQW